MSDFETHSDIVTLTQKVERIFDAVVDLPLAQRVEKVNELAKGNASVASDVLELLSFESSADGQTDFILERPIFSPEAQRFLKQNDPRAEQVGDIIDRYQLTQLLGEGGMGVVFQAEQLTDIRRKVALKIIKRSSETNLTAARFENECQAMAKLNHAGIAKVLDAGTTQSHRPFLVMELVHGDNLIEFANKNQLDLESRLKLFSQICEAVQHAHQKGVIHRDLKPSNILVSMNDGSPIPKVIDFGIATALNQPESQEPIGTLLGGLTGTPQYMSPEQATWGTNEIDTRTDIYSLGILLYELITGSTPLSVASLKDLNPIELVEKVRKQKIIPPSKRIEEAQSKSVSSKHSSFTSKKYRIHGALDCIVRKSLSSDPAQRYASAAELSADIDRFLDHTPVDAVPYSIRYRLSTFLTKHKRAATLTLFTLLGLLAASICCVVFGIHAMQSNASKDQALFELRNRNRQLAEARLALQESTNQKRYSLAVKNAVMVTAMEEMRNSRHPFPSFQSPIELLHNATTGFQLIEFIREDLEPLLTATEEARKQESTFFDRARKLEEGSWVSQAFATVAFAQPRPTRNQRSKMELEHRTHLLRNLVEECQIEFNGKGLQLASSLNLLAASLLEQQKSQEAAAHLQHAISLNGSPEQRERSLKLLKFAKEEME